jgi:hypothetical protein
MRREQVGFAAADVSALGEQAVEAELKVFRHGVRGAVGVAPQDGAEDAVVFGDGELARAGDAFRRALRAGPGQQFGRRTRPGTVW